MRRGEKGQWASIGRRGGRNKSGEKRSHAVAPGGARVGRGPEIGPRLFDSPPSGLAHDRRQASLGVRRGAPP